MRWLPRVDPFGSRRDNVSSTYKNPDVITLFVKASRVYRTDEFIELMEELSIVKPNEFNKIIKDNVLHGPVHFVQFDDMI